MTESRQSRHGEDFNITKIQRRYGVAFATRLAIVQGAPALQPQQDGESDEAYTERLLHWRFNRRHRAARAIIDDDLQRIAHLAYPDQYDPPQETR